MSDNRKNSKKDEVPIWFKPTLSIEETSRYSGIGMSKLYELTNPEDCPFVLWIGTRRMIKRRKFDEYIERMPKEKIDTILLYNEQDVVNLFKILTLWGRYMKEEVLSNDNKKEEDETQ